MVEKEDQFKKAETETEISERERLEKELISYEEFKKLSEEILTKYKEGDGSFRGDYDLNKAPKIIDRIVESFPDEVREISRKLISGEIIKEDKVVVIKEEALKELKEKTENWIKLIKEEFKDERDKDFLNDSMLVKHMWATPLQALSVSVELIEDGCIEDKIKIEKSK